MAIAGLSCSYVAASGGQRGGNEIKDCLKPEVKFKAGKDVPKIKTPDDRWAMPYFMFGLDGNSAYGSLIAAGCRKSDATEMILAAENNLKLRKIDLGF